MPDSFVKNKVGRQNQIPAKEIAEVGRFPVVDQGQKFVTGLLGQFRHLHTDIYGNRGKLINQAAYIVIYCD